MDPNRLKIKKECNKRYHDNNRERINENVCKVRRELRDANTEYINCPCSGKYVSYGYQTTFNVHKKSLLHQSYARMLEMD